MKKIIVDKSKLKKEKQYIIRERNIIVFERFSKGFSKVDIARMIGVNKSVITNIMKNNFDDYQKWIFLNCK